MISTKHVVYFGNLVSKCGAIKHMGDNLTGAGDGDDEQVTIKLDKIDQDIHKLLFVVNIFQAKQRKQDFGKIQNAFIRVVNADNNQEIIKYNLTEDYAGKTALTIGEVYRYQADWKFAAIGEGTEDLSLTDIVKRY